MTVAGNSICSMPNFSARPAQRGQHFAAVPSRCGCGLARIPDVHEIHGRCEANRFGLLRADHLLPGDYTIGKGVSEIVGLQEPVAQFSASVSPNPASDFVRISAEQKFSKLLIFNALGDAVRELSFDDCREKQIPVGDLPTGMYWFWLHGKAGAAAVSFQAAVWSRQNLAQINFQDI